MRCKHKWETVKHDYIGSYAEYGSAAFDIIKSLFVVKSYKFLGFQIKKYRNYLAYPTWAGPQKKGLIQVKSQICILCRKKRGFINFNAIKAMMTRRGIC